MTPEMLRIILRVALHRLATLPGEELVALVPWLEHEHIAWCLTYVQELTLQPEDLVALHFLRQAVSPLRTEG
jgi:hypothetical protein